MVSARADATPISKSAVMSVAEIASKVAAVTEMRIIDYRRARLPLVGGSFRRRRRRIELCQRRFNGHRRRARCCSVRS